MLTSWLLVVGRSWPIVLLSSTSRDRNLLSRLRETYANENFTVDVDDSNFPPLPVGTDNRPDYHSRVSSLSNIGATRSSTPKVPPGFENLPLNPASVTGVAPAQSITDQTHAIVPVASTSDVLPPEATANAGPDARSASKQTRTVPDKEEDSLRRTKSQSTSPALADSHATDHPLVRSVLDPRAKENILEQHKSAQVKDATAVGPGNRELGLTNTNVAQKPFELQTPIEVDVATSSAKGETSVQALGEEGSKPLDAMKTQPIASAAGSTDVSLHHAASNSRPRTIRLTTEMIQKEEAVKSASTPVGEKPITPIISVVRQEHSRQPSLSSAQPSRPSSPSVSSLVMSQDVSRAGSPPATGIAGAAQVRGKSKSQAKKERREKSKKATETSDAIVVHGPSTPVTEQVGPISTRAKKQKKSKTIPAAPDSATLKQPASDPELTKQEIAVKNSMFKLSSPPKSVAEETLSTPSPLPQEASGPPSPSVQPSIHKSSYTVRDLCNDASRTPADPAAIQNLLTTHVMPFNKLLPEMLASSDLTKDHPWLTTPSFSSAAYKLPVDSRKGQEYLKGNGYGINDAFGYVYLPQKEKRALYAGHAVSVADTGERRKDLLRRCLITPNGWVMRHLSSEESERVLELEERRSMYAEEWGEIGIMNGLGALETDDFINLEGGIENLGRSGDRHGVCWVLNNNDLNDDCEGDEPNFGDLGGDELVDAGDEGDALSYETDEDLGIDLSENTNSLPGPWDAAFADAVAAAAEGEVGSNVLAPMVGVARNINLRAIDMEQLHKRVSDMAKEADVCRKEVEKSEKAMLRKAKEFGRWRDGILRA